MKFTPYKSLMSARLPNNRTLSATGFVFYLTFCPSLLQSLEQLRMLFGQCLRLSPIGTALLTSALYVHRAQWDSHKKALSNFPDRDECKEHLCSQGCNNTVGSYRCFCVAGYRLGADRLSCEGMVCMCVNKMADGTGCVKTVPVIFVSF